MTNPCHYKYEDDVWKIYIKDDLAMTITAIHEEHVETIVYAMNKAYHTACKDCEEVCEKVMSQKQIK